MVGRYIIIILYNNRQNSKINYYITPNMYANVCKACYGNL